jgi:lipoyl(octanoyl) transferase
VVNYYYSGRGSSWGRLKYRKALIAVCRDQFGSNTAVHLPVVQAYLLGTLDFEKTQSLLQRLSYEVAGDPNCSSIIICDHPQEITVGREGSLVHIHTSRCPVRWLARGGGVVLHTPGQVACYPILPLDRMQLTPAAYVDGLCGVVGDLLAGFGIKAEVATATVRVNGRRIAHFGIAVRNWITSSGFIINVSPDLELFRNIDSDGDQQPVTSIQRECLTRIRQATVRQRLLELLEKRFGFGRLSVFHHHPTFLPRTPSHALASHRR